MPSYPSSENISSIGLTHGHSGWRARHQLEGRKAYQYNPGMWNELSGWIVGGCQPCTGWRLQAYVQRLWSGTPTNPIVQPYLRQLNGAGRAVSAVTVPTVHEILPRNLQLYRFIAVDAMTRPLSINHPAVCPTFEKTYSPEAFLFILPTANCPEWTKDNRAEPQDLDVGIH